MKDHPFMTTLNRVERNLKTAQGKAKFISELFEFGKTEEAYKEAFRLEDLLEKTVLLSRTLPTYTGNKHAVQDVRNILEEVIPVEIGFTEEGWFSLRMPAILPRKESGGTDYLKQFLYPAMKKFMSGKDISKLENAVLIFRHVYPESRPERQIRDHDNIEINTVSDIVSLYILRDDSPKYCSHYYCSAVGEGDRTEVYAVPREEFEMWFECEKEMPKEGVMLYENAP